MADKELAAKSFGDGEMELSFNDGKLKLSAGLDTKGVDVGIYIDLEPDYFLDKLAEAIPGEIDDAIIAMLKVAFKA